MKYTSKQLFDFFTELYETDNYDELVKGLIAFEYCLDPSENDNEKLLDDILKKYNEEVFPLGLLNMNFFNYYEELRQVSY